MTLHSSPPRDAAKLAPVATGSAIKTFWMASATNGDWQAVSLPAGTECKAVLIQVHDGTDTGYDPDAGNVGFLFSSEAAGTGWSRYGVDGLSLSIGKVQADGGVIGYIKATADKKVAVTILF